MRRSFMWFWKKGVLSTFLAGLFAMLPIVMTLGIMQREFETVDASEMLETSFRRLQSCQCHPVLRRGELVGLVTMDNVGEFVAIRAAEKDFAVNGNERPR